jgi:hypothetical protein
VYVHVCVYVCICVYIYVCVCVYLGVCVCVCVCVCVLHASQVEEAEGCESEVPFHIDLLPVAVMVLENNGYGAREQ